MLDLTILHGTVPGNEHQEATDCFLHEDGYRSRCGVSSLRARKPCAGCDERYSLMSTRSGGRTYCLSCNPSCVESCFWTKVKLFEGTGC